MNRELKFTPTSYIVLGLLLRLGEATPYDLERMVPASVGYFWSLSHTQLYAESARLARGGFLAERCQQGGRRRKLYTVTDYGRGALEDWLRAPTSEPRQLRDIATLKLFFGADTRELAEVEIEAHRRKLADYDVLRGQASGDDRKGLQLALDNCAEHSRAMVCFWSAHAI
jgi:PadR family transcriptional regulator AphA